MSTENSNSELILRDIRAIYERLQNMDERFDEVERDHATVGDLDHATRRIDVLEDMLDIMGER